MSGVSDRSDHGSGDIAQLPQEFFEFIAAAVNVADDVEWAVLVALVVVKRHALTFLSRIVDCLCRVRDWWKKPFVDERFANFHHSRVIHRRHANGDPADCRFPDEQRPIPPKMMPPLVPPRVE